MKASRVAGTCAVVLAAACALGCGKTGKGQAAAVPSLPVGGQGPVDEPPVGVDPETCSTPQPGPTPLHRLTGFELGNTLVDLFPDSPELGTALKQQLQDQASNYFDDPSLDPTTVAVDVYHRLAHQAALTLTADAPSLSAFAGCDPLEVGEAACQAQLIQRVLLRTYRRPPSGDDVAEMDGVFARGQELGGDFASGARAVLEVALQSPDFLYLIEQGEGDAQDGAVALTPFETAARLSYFLTGSAPDAELVAAADANVLDEAADLEAHARRLLGTPPNRQVSRRFYEQLFRLNFLEATTAENPAYTPQILQLSREETDRFVEDVTFDGAGTFEALMTEPFTWVNAPLAAFYGDIPGITGDAFQKVQLDPQRRSGILTLSAFLTATSPGGRTHPINRGLAVLNKVLCVELPAPPADIDQTVPDTIPEPATTRQRYEAAITGPACLDCHRDMDAIGFAFENYDAFGLWRESELGLPIDPSGTLSKTDAQGAFANALELIQHIAVSDDAHACFVGNWLSYAYGRKGTDEDACARQELETAFRDSNGNIKELLVALAKTAQLRFRLASELAP